MRLLLFAIAPLVLSCAGASDSADPINATALACKYGEAVPDDPTPYLPGYPATPGQPTAAYLHGKRLYDAERWPDAIAALQSVVSGQSNDDEGNRQLAAFYVGVCFYRLHQYGSALDMFEPIAKNPSHFKHKEAELWLGALAREPLTAERAVDLLYLYTDKELAALDNPQQRDVLYIIQFARARAAYRKGRYDEALAILLHVRTYAPLRKLADGCTTLAAAARGKGR